jgi:UDP-GlcNAc:undecaprenyl-phosphate/decaprenyl-phosphate GlcNAc-1-phosphate transferase
METYNLAFDMRYNLINLDQSVWLNLSEYFPWLIVFIFSAFISTAYFWPIYNKTTKYKGQQRVHEGEIPRLGGMVIYVSLILGSLMINEVSLQEEFQFTLLYMLPMMLIILIEDIYHNVSVKLRFLSLVITALLLANGEADNWPIISNLGIISILFESSAFNLVFFSLCLIALANGCNFFDGMNGLLGLYCLGALFSCLNLAYLVGSSEFMLPIYLLITVTVIFLCFNFPYGKIFAGDSGAYLLAMIIGIWVIKFFAEYENISSWNAALIFFYPIAELTFSIIRKVYQKKSPFYPDRAHLHLKIYDLINNSLNKPKVSNNITTIFLALFWMAPPLLLPWVYYHQLLIFISIFILTLCYIVLNKVIPESTV